MRLGCRAMICTHIDTLPMLPKNFLDQQVPLGGQGGEEQPGPDKLLYGRSWGGSAFYEEERRPTRTQSWLWLGILSRTGLGPGWRGTSRVDDRADGP